MQWKREERGEKGKEGRGGEGRGRRGGEGVNIQRTEGLGGKVGWMWRKRTENRWKGWKGEGEGDTYSSAWAGNKVGERKQREGSKGGRKGSGTVVCSVHVYICKRI